MGKVLDRVYFAAAVVAGTAIVMICLLISAQIILNGLGRAFPGTFPTTIPSYADFSGYLLAAATFLALAHTLRAGGHVRVTLLTGIMPRRLGALADAAVLVLGLAVTGMATWFMGQLTAASLRYGDTSSGIVPIPLALPQSVATLGLALLVVALLHTLVEVVARRAPVLTAPGEV